MKIEKFLKLLENLFKYGLNPLLENKKVKFSLIFCGIRTQHTNDNPIFLFLDKIQSFIRYSKFPINYFNY